MIIIGAGMSGLLAGQLLQRHNTVRIVEAQGSLPNNHAALLRFRSPSVGDILGVPFKSVNMVKGYLPWQNPVADMMAYSRKCTGYYRSDRSILTAGLESHKRWIAPPDLITYLSRGLDISLKTVVNKSMLESWRNKPVISTIPLPVLLTMLELKPCLQFNYVLGLSISVDLGPTFDTYATLYIPDPARIFYRISITGSQLMLEYAYPGESLTTVREHKELLERRTFQEAADALKLLGVTNYQLVTAPEVRLQRYAKILPISNQERRSLIAHITEHFGIYSLGRFATWRPGLLLDDLINDVRVITKLMDDPYELRHFNMRQKA
jgi:hypothetical protein